MKKRKTNKSQAIRDYYDDHPDAKPLEVVQALASKGVSVKPHVVSTTRYNMRKQQEAGGASPPKKKAVAKKTGKRKTATASASASASGSGFQDLFEAKKLVDRVGGIQEARKLLETLSQLR